MNWSKQISKKNMLVSSVILTIGLLSGCDNDADQPAIENPAVSVFQVKTEEVGQYLEFVARTEPNQSVEIRARVEGELISRSFTEGGIVTKGQELFQIDPDQYSASLAEAEAALKSQRVGAANALRNLERGQELSKTGFISNSDLDKLVTTSSQAEAAVRSAEANLEKASLNLQYSTIHAPFTGSIGRVKFNVGNLVTPQSDSLATLISIDPMYVNFQLEEARYLNYLQMPEDIQQEVNLTLRLPNNQVYTGDGVVNFADTRIDESTGTVAMRAEFSNKNGSLVPGLFVTLMIETEDKESVALVPQVAVQENQQGKFVLVVGDDNKVVARVVQLGRRMNAMWVVESGLEAGEQIIIEGLQKVRPGVEVEPIEKTIDSITGTITELTNQ
ncbi:MAG: efflux RND transporter periplasmic adaptor subunit [Pseudomonadales bacterium]|jgi:membrane fusion protein (multidrug efflux system)|tara:strand:- start:363 stop:1526 length:1164 start_codon:yes stop_codon:yes gene_type:complete